jgi:non-ribosomal peptide synthetase component F/acyl carrier protein
MEFTLDLKRKFAHFVKKQKITSASLLYSAWGIFLQKYNYSEDVVFDITVSVRPPEIKGVENIVGLFINTLPFRVKVHGAERISNFLLRINEQLQYRKNHENCSAAYIKEIEGLDKEVFFDSVLAIENYPLDRQLMQKNGPLVVDSFSIFGTTRYDLTVLITIFDDIGVTFTYDKTLFTVREMENLAAHFRRVVEFLIENPEKKVSEISILPAEGENPTVYLLDRYRSSVVEGAVGEIYKPAEAFPGGCLDMYRCEGIEHPFIPGEKLYPTGVIARKLWDGSIEEVGWKAGYVPINGYGIKSEYIEGPLLNHPGILQAVVMGRENKEKGTYLCAYVVSAEVLDGSELREFLAGKLPDYMIPSFFIQLEKLPLKQNGKLDRKMLPVPGVETDSRRYARRGNEIERKLAGIWSQLLQIDKERIEADINFFESGGHSTKAIVLASRIHKELNIKIPLAEVFKRPTFAELERFIKETAEGGKFSLPEPVEKKGYYPVSSAQERVFTLQQMDLESTVYNGPFAVVLEGTLNKECFEEAFRGLTHRHESLRTSFELLGDRPVQRIHPEVDAEIEYLDADGQDPGMLLGRFIKPFDLERPPLFRVKLLKIEDGRRILFVDMHHIITDGASAEILLDELLLLYEGKKLPSLEIQYKDYAQWQNSTRELRRIKKQESHWLNCFKEEITLLNLPFDFPRSRARGGGGSQVIFEIGKKETKDLKKIMAEKEITLYILLLSVFNILLSKYTGQEDILIGTVTSGRTHEAVQHIIGLFTNFLPMRNYPGGGKTIGDFLEEVKRSTFAAFENQDYQYEALIKQLNIKREPGRDPLIDAAFTVQNMNIDEAKSKTIRENSHLKAIPFEFDAGITKWALDLFANEKEETIGMTLVYSTQLFRESSARMIAKHFVEVLRQVLEDDTVKLKDIRLYHDLSPSRKSAVVEDDSGDFQF